MNEFEKYHKNTLIVRKINFWIVIVSLLMIFASLCFAVIMTEVRYHEMKQKINYVVIAPTKTNRPVYRDPFYSKQQIQANILTCLKIYKKKWTSKNVADATNALYIGERYYKINHKLILTMIAVESRFKIKAWNINTNATIDFGLTQQNSDYIQERYTHLLEIFKSHNIKFNPNNQYDVVGNILAGYMFYNDINKMIGTINPKRFITAYNVGIRGSKLSRYKERRDKYYNAFVSHYNIIASNITY